MPQNNKTHKTTKLKKKDNVENQSVGSHYSQSRHSLSQSLEINNVIENNSNNINNNEMLEFQSFNSMPNFSQQQVTYQFGEGFGLKNSINNKSNLSQHSMLPFSQNTTQMNCCEECHSNQLETSHGQMVCKECGAVQQVTHSFYLMCLYQSSFIILFCKGVFFLMLLRNFAI